MLKKNSTLKKKVCKVMVFIEAYSCNILEPKLSDCHPAKKNAGDFPNKFLMTPAKQLS